MDSITFTGTVPAGSVVEDTGTVTDNPNTVTVETGAFLTTSGSIEFNDSDPDTDPGPLSSVFHVPFATPVGSTLGTVTVNIFNDATGGADLGYIDWVYAVDNALVQYLAVGETRVETFNILVVGYDGEEQNRTLTITITGTNDGPAFISGPVVASGNEDSLASVAGTLNFNDVDILDTHTTSTTVVASGNGVVPGSTPTTAQLLAMMATTTTSTTTSAAGSVAYNFTANNPLFQYLHGGETLTLTYTLTIADGNGGTAAQTVTIDVTGTNDIPTITAATTQGGVIEVGAGVTGNATITGDASNGGANWVDLDHSEDATLATTPAVMVGAYGVLTLQANGQYSYTLDNTLMLTQGLDSGQTATDVFSYAIGGSGAGSASSTITIQIAGSNDAPVLSSITPPATFDENTASPSNEDPGASGSFTVTDVDASDTLTATAAAAVVRINGNVVTTGFPAALANALSITPASENSNFGTPQSFGWSYAPGSVNLDFLSEGDTLTVTYAITASDGTISSSTQNLVVTITGSNDPTTIQILAGDSILSDINETNTGLSTSGTLHVHDADLNDAPTGQVSALTIVGDAGGISAATLQAMLSVTAGDLTVPGTDSGILTWTFNSGSQAFDYLDAGEVLELQYTLEVSAIGPNPTQVVTVRITGTNDVPVINGVTFAPQANSGIVEIAAGDTFNSIANAYLVSGEYSLAFNPEIYNSTTVPHVSFVVQTDGTAEFFSVVLPNFTFNSPNQNFVVDIDSPVGSPDAFLMGLFGSNTFPSDNNIAVADPTVNPLDPSLSFTGNGNGAIITFRIGTSASSGVAGLPTGGSYIVHISNPGYTGPTTHAGNLIDETNAPLATSGTISFSDADASDTPEASYDPLTGLSATVANGPALTAPQLAAFANGFSVTAGGAFAFAVASPDYLGADDVVTLNYTVVVTDDLGATDTEVITITINGTNDVPVISTGPAIAALNEDGGMTAGGLIAFSDADLTDVHVATVDVARSGSGNNAGLTLTNAQLIALVSTTVTPTVGGVGGVVNYQFSGSNAAFQYLQTGQTLVLTYTMGVNDGNGGTAYQTFTINIAGSNDGPVATADVNGADVVFEAGIDALGAPVAGDSSAVGNVLTNDTDADFADTRTVQGVAAGSFAGPLTGSVGTAVTGTYGTLNIAAGGGYTYTLNNADSDTDGLAVGQTATDVFSYTVVDSQGATATTSVTITITGTNDAPVILVADDTGAVTEDQSTPSIGDFGFITFDDVDLTDTHSVSVTAAGGNTLGGSLTAIIMTPATGAGTGQIGWNYAVANGFAQYLAAGQTVTEDFTVTLSDGNGGTVSQLVSITITGTNDTPVITAGGTTTGAITEAAGLATTTVAATGSFEVTDVDANNTLTISEGATSVVWSGGTVPGDVEAALTAAAAFTITDSNPSATAVQLDWTLNAGALDLNFLGAGETLTVTVPVTVTDGIAPVVQNVVITITGTNDGPVITNGGDSATISEVAGLTGPGATSPASVGGDFTVADADANGTIALTSSFQGFVSNYGPRLTLTAAQQTALAAGLTFGPLVGNDGVVTWTYSVNNSVIDFLVEAEVLTATLLVTASDGNGGTTTTTVAITINGRNDQVVQTGALVLSGTWSEDAPASPPITGAIGYTDADFSNHGLQVFNLSGNLVGSGGLPVGVLTASNSANPALDDGVGEVVWSYTLAAGTANYLAVGETATETFMVRIIDTAGAPLDNVVTITITGANDAPVISTGPQSATFTEDAGLSTSGSLLFNDADVTDTHSASTAVVASGSTGGLTLSNGQLLSLFSTTVTSTMTSTSGSVAYSFAGTNADFQYLAQGETLTLTYNVTVSDGNGGTDSESVTVTITGNNDGPFVASVTGGTLPPLNGGNAPFTVVAADAYNSVGTALNIDGGFNLATDANIANSGQRAHATINATADNVSDFYRFTVTEAGTTGVFDIDNTTGGGTDTVLYLMDSAGNIITFQDDNGGDPGSVSNGLHSLLTHTFANAGTYYIVVARYTGTFTPADALVGFGVGQTYQLHVSLDFHPAGTGGDAALTEGSIALTTSGVITFDDPDFTDTVTASYSATTDAAITATGITLTAAQRAQIAAAFSVTPATGAFRFNLASPDYLGAGNVVTAVFTVTGTDPFGLTVTQAITVTITGSNDLPLITVVGGDSANANLTEGNAALSAAGTMTVADADIFDTSTASITGVAFTGNAGGQTNTELLSMLSVTAGDLIANPGSTGSLTWNFASTPQTFDYLTATQSLTLTYTIRVTDGNGAFDDQVLVVFIQGSNDAPTITAATVTTGVVEDGVTTASGDVSVGGANWTDVDDGEDATLAITAGGTNAGGQTTLAFDNSGTGSLPNEATIVGTYGSLYLEADGSYRYVLNNAGLAVQSLDGDQTVSEVFHYTISDVSGGTATATITTGVQGTNDTATIVVTNRGNVFESDTSAIVSFTVADQVAITDVDTQDAANAQDYVAGSGVLSTASGLTPPAGTILSLISFNATTGAISYDRNAFNWLDAGQSVTFTVNFDAQSGDDGVVGQSFTFTIDGQNDAPVTVNDTITLAENVNGSLNVIANDSDPDTADTVSLSSIALLSVTGLGTLTALELADLTNDFVISGNSIVFTPGAGLPGSTETVYDRLNPGDTATIVFTYQASDGTASTPGTYTLTLTGAAENYVGTPLDDNPFLGSSFDDNMFGLAGDDNISGNGGDDVLDGGTDDDVLSGGSGDDTLIGGAGDDILSGGSDTDTAVFANNWAAYTITVGPTPGSYLLYGPGGEVDEISSVELVIFNGSGPFAVATILNDAPTTSNASASVNENVVGPTPLVTVVASDVDAPLGDVLGYAITGGNGGGLFSINATTGAVSIATGQSLDRETAASHTLTVTVTDIHGATATSTVTITVNDLNDNNPVFQSGTTASVNENAAITTVVYDANATDADLTFGPIVYSLGGADAALFNIDSATGEVRLNASADYEADTGYAISVTATQGTTATTQSVTVSVTDLNDNNPVFQSGNTAVVIENTATSFVVYDANATDADVSFGPISYTLGGADAAFFTIDGATGEVRLNASADYETRTSYAISVTATQGATATTQAVTVSVTDLNDNNPVFQSGNTASVNENAAISTVVYDANATDADATFGAISYTLGGADAALFNINATTGEVRLNASADYEADTSYSFSVTATQGTTATTQSVTVSVNDLNDNNPVFQSGTTASVNENAAIATVVYDADATDADVTFSAITYTLGGADAALFNIDSATGEVRLNASADYEADTGYSISVTATQGTTATTQNVTISVNDLNDNNPVFSSGNTASVNENAAIATIVYDANATDADVTFGPISYTLGGADAALFNINATTGEVRLNASADYEADTSYSISVTATQGTTATTQSVTVSVNDLNDNLPVFQSGTTASINENAAISTVVYDANATDADISFGPISYTLGGADAALFNIDAATGEVRLNASADYEADTSYAISVTATQGITATTQSVTISVNDLNDNAPVFTSGTTATVAENAATTTVVYDANSTDVDTVGGPTTYSLGGADAALFSIDSATGEVRLLASADYEADTGYSIDVIASDGANTTTQSVTVSVTDLNDNNPVFQSGNSATVAENVAAGTLVYTAAATDADVSFGPVSYSLTGANAAAFAINAATGAVTLIASPDFETQSSYAINVVATQGTTATTQAVTIAVTDLNDNNPVFQSGTTASVNENAAVATVVYDAAATDADATFGPITYTLGGADAALFNIDANTGEVRLNASADYELDTGYSIDVTATQGTTATTQSVTVSVNDLNDNNPVFQSGTTASVNENAAIATVVYDADATDADATFGPIVYSLDGADAALFNIDSATGEVRLNASADYEADTSYSIDVIATQGTTATTRSVTISVNDLNDNNPVFQSGAAGNVDENAAIATVVYDANATDADATFGPITYTLGGADAALFNIDAATGEVRLNASADYELDANYSISVTATQGATATTQSVTVSVNDLNDNSPVFQSGTTASVNENAAIATVVYDADATDADATFGPIVYSLGGADAALFNIDSATGEIRLNASADYELDASYSIDVTATQGATATTQSVTVNVNDLNDNNPVFQSGNSATVAENVAAGTLVYTAAATDADVSFGPVSYSLTGADAAAFAINATTGEVTLIGSPDFEVQTSYAINVIATQGTTATTQAVTVSVTDLNDNAPVFESGTTATVAENAPTATVIYDANATDVDTVGGPIVYSLGGLDAALFNINAATGEVTLITSADYEADTSYSFIVFATQGTTSSQQNVTVTVTDQNEFAVGPVTVIGGSANEISATGQTVGTASAVDADGTATVTYSLVNSAGGRFAINATTGVITVVNGLLLDFEQNPTHQVTVRATSSDGSFSDGVATITVNNVDPELVIGTNAAETIVGGALVDSFVLGGGNDVGNGGGGGDAIDGGDGDDLLVGGDGDDSLEGGLGTDYLIGGDGIDLLSGGTGAGNTLQGGTGNDIYIIATNGDSVLEFAGEGTDEVRTALTVHTLQSNVEVLRYTGAANFLGIGNTGDNTLIGGGASDDLYGRDGNDRIQGGAGVANTLLGGLGNDVYILEAFGDSTIEVAGEGTDTVETALSVHTLQANIENLTLTGSSSQFGVGNALDNVMRGGTSADDLYGRAGNDTLRGGTGSANTLLGQEGDDLYIVEAAGDTVIEFAGEGTDTVETALSSFVLRDNVENLTYTGTAGFTGIGSSDGNTIRGGAGVDFLSGLDGNDTLIGGNGADILVGGNGADDFRVVSSETGVDRILDFTSGSDRISLQGFAHSATLNIVQGAGAQTATNGNSTFLYNQTNGELSYDADGNGAGAAVVIATLNPSLTLALGDFFFI